MQSRGAVFGSPFYIPGNFIPAILRATHLLEHFSHLSVLAEQVVDFLHAGSRTAGNPFAAAAVDGFVMVAFVSGHGIDNGLDAIDLLFVNLVRGFLQAGKRTNTRQHADKALQRPHFAHLP
jgi:hypothetical protein